jgi:hypothetical protein
VGVILRVERSGRAWLVRHNDGFLGAVESHDEAQTLARDLCAWLVSMGREAQVVAVEDGQAAKAA